MTEHTNNSIWPILTYRDAAAAIAFLNEAFGFETAEVHEGEEPGTVAHAELLWSEGGGIMLSSAGLGEEPFAGRQPGYDLNYIVCSDPDELHDRSLAAGAEIVMGLRDTDYGSRDFAARDPEGNLWSFGTYAGSSLNDSHG